MRAPTKQKALPVARGSHAERTARSDRLMCAAAIELILQGGVHSTTLREIGERAGYSRGLAGSRFGTKEAFLSHLVTQFNLRWTAELNRRVGSLTGLPAFLAALEAVESFITSEPDETRAMYILWYESITSHSDVRAVHAEQHAILRRDAKQWIDEGIADGTVSPATDSDSFSIQFCAFLFGTIYQWLISPEAIILNRAFGEYRKAAITLLTQR